MQNSRASAAPPRRFLSCSRTDFTGVVKPQQGQVADARLTVPSPTSGGLHPPLARSRISKSTRFALGFGTIFKATDFFAFFASHSDRISGTSAPQPAPSQRIVRAQRYEIGVAPSGSFG